MTKEPLENITGTKKEEPNNDKLAIAYRKTVSQIKARLKNNEIEREKLGVEYETLCDILDTLEREAQE